MRSFLAVSLCAVLCLFTATPAAADVMDGLGWGFGTDMGILDPMDASTLLDDGLGVADGTALLSTFTLSVAPAEDYLLVADMASNSQLAIDSADLARQSQEVAEAKRQAALQSQSEVGPDGCPVSVPSGTLRSGADSLGIYQLCANSVAQAPTPAAAAAIKFALRNVGAPYACGGAGRLEDFKFDCSSFVARAYHEGAGLSTAGDSWAPTTRDMVPWDGVALASWLTKVEPADVRPGDLVLYDTGGSNYRHVVMVLSDGFMVHTNSCGDVAHVTSFWGYDSRFLVARRVTG